MADHTDSRDKNREGNSNALKHGMFAKAFLLAEEDRDEYTVLRRALHKDWRPQGATEIVYFTSIVQCAWNLIRVNRWIRDRRVLEQAVPAQLAGRRSGRGAQIYAHRTGRPPNHCALTVSGQRRGGGVPRRKLRR